MAKHLKTAREVAAMKTPGRYNAGRNLFLRVRPTPGGLSKTWEGQFTCNGKTLYPGLGSVADVPLGEARDKATEWRTKCKTGINPLDERKAAKQAEAKRRTFLDCANELIASKESSWRSPVHAAQWRLSIDRDCAPLHKKFVDEIDTDDVLSTLKPIWTAIPETASRARSRIEMTLDSARAKGLIPRDAPNPARWRGHLELLLAKRARHTRGHHAAMPYLEIPVFLAGLRAVDSVASLALQFTVLTAARSGETIGARWSEIDREAQLWTIPASRMKASVAHTVPLSTGALAILDELAAHRMSDFVFPGIKRGRPIGSTAMAGYVPKPFTVHGMRSAFRDWCGDQTNFPREIAEACLAHSVGNATEAAYRRGSALEKRSQLMQAWCSYCEPMAGGNVIVLRS